MGRNLLLTGLPRSGTTLACRLLADRDGVVALAEPMEVMAIPADSRAAAVEHVMAWLAATRLALLERGVAPSKVGKAGLVDNPFSAADGSGRRELQVTEGALTLPLPPSAGFTLAVKHNAAFTALLPELAGQAAVVAIVRHPLAVLASWTSLSLPVSHGRLPAGERLDPQLAGSLAATGDLLERQLTILSWFYSRYRALAPACVVRYEDIVATGALALYEAAGLGGDARATSPLQNLNAAPQCAPEVLPRLAEALQQRDGEWTGWYPASTIATVLASMESP